MANRRFLLAGLVLTLSVSSAGSADFTYHQLLSAPDWYWLAACTPTINNNGQIAFTALKDTGGQTVRGGVWLYDHGTVSPVATEYASAGNGITFRTLASYSRLNLDDTGTVTFDAEIKGAGVTESLNDVALFVARPGQSPQMLAQTYSVVPAISPDQVTSWALPTVRDGTACFRVTLYAASRDSALVTSHADGSLQVITEGDTISGAVVGQISVYYQLQNGQVSFTSRPATGGNVIYCGTNGQLTRIVAQYLPAPPPNVGTFGSPQQFDTNAAGQVLFSANLVSGSSTRWPNYWIGSSAGVIPLALAHDPVPGLPGQYLSPFGRVQGVINSAGMAAFVMGIGPDPNASSNASVGGVFVGHSQQDLQLICQTGTMIDGTYLGLVQQMTMNASGQLMIRGSEHDTSADALWIWDPVMGMHKIVADNEPLTVDGVTRTVRYFNIATGGGDDGWPRGLNDDGTIVFSVKYTDNTEGLVVTQVPEPATMFLLAAGSLTILRRRGRARGELNKAKRSRRSARWGGQLSTIGTIPNVAGCTRNGSLGHMAGSSSSHRDVGL